MQRSLARLLHSLDRVPSFEGLGLDSMEGGHLLEVVGLRCVQRALHPYSFYLSLPIRRRRMAGCRDEQPRTAGDGHSGSEL